MTLETRLKIVVALSLTGLGAQSAMATDPAGQPSAGGEQSLSARGLKASELAAIQKVGRSILVAKRNGGVEDADDAMLVDRLRANLDALLTSNHDPQGRAAINRLSQEGDEQRKSREKVASVRESARVDAQALAAQLRSRSELKVARARGAPEADTRSAGLPIGEQRARLFKRWAENLESALASGDEDGVGRLRELRDQLHVTKGGLSDPSLTHGTPTLQAMPAGYVAPTNDGTAKKQGK